MLGKGRLELINVISLFEHQQTQIEDVRTLLRGQGTESETVVKDHVSEELTDDQMMANVLDNVPENQREAFLEIFALLVSFCKEYFDHEYVVPVTFLLDEVITEGLPVHSGKTSLWAAGIAYTVAKVNFLTDRDHPQRITPKEFALAFNVSYSGMQAKSALIEGLLEIIPGDPDFTVFSGLYDNPYVWRICLDDGRVVDARALPHDQQVWLCEQNYIPFVYADGNPYAIDED